MVPTWFGEDAFPDGNSISGILFHNNSACLPERAEGNKKRSWAAYKIQECECDLLVGGFSRLVVEADGIDIKNFYLL